MYVHIGQNERRWRRTERTIINNKLARSARIKFLFAGARAAFLEGVAFFCGNYSFIFWEFYCQPFRMKYAFP